MKFEVRNRFTGEVKFTAEIEANESSSYGFKLGLAVKWAIANKADLSRANLSYANLSDADLSEAYLSDANLSDANLSYANLSDADLSYANLSDADLSDANLSYANLSDADLSYADLSRANLSDANLSYANLSDADLSEAYLSDAELPGSIGNKNEIRSIQLDTWNVTFTKDILQIGCQRHTHEEWMKFEDHEIAGMSGKALEWWNKWKEFIFKAIELSFTK